jgi:hypothetical protein
MSMMVLAVIIIASFLSIESRLAAQQNLNQRARLNSIAALRLALGHLQQEAGPDRRSTARADITQPNVSGASLLNPMWTGVWRSDYPNQPPQWLVSGRGDQPAGSQSISLFGQSDYPDAMWTPWQSTYFPVAKTLVPLVGSGTASGAETDKPSGLVSLPKVTLPDDGANGYYAYWIGDEGIKARINFQDSRTTSTSNSIGALAALHSPLAPGVNLIQGFENFSTFTDLPKLESVRQLTSLTGFNDGTSTPLNSRRLFHDLTGYAAGVLADSYHGGLKRDLSLAFELSEADFAASEFGAGKTGAAGTTTENGIETITMSIPFYGNTIPVTPIFNRTTPNGNLRGPAWSLLRDYHRLYKQLGWSGSGSPILTARTFYPNANVLHPTPDNGDPATIRQRLYTYPETYIGDNGVLDPNVSDSGTLYGQTNQPIPRPLNVAATPYVSRVQMVFSVNQETFFSGGYFYGGIWFNMTPIVVLHNPYNVAMSLNGNVNGQTNNSAVVLTFTNWSQWVFRFKRYTNYGLGPTLSFEIPLSLFFSLQDDQRSNDSDMFRIDIPNFVLQPGEYRVFSASNPGTVDWHRVVSLTNAFNQSGGFNDTLDQWGFDASSMWSTTDAFGFEVLPAGDFRVRYGLACWPGDTINSTMDTATLYQHTSEHTELYYRNLDPTRVGVAGEKFFGNYAQIAPKLVRGIPQPPSIITVMDLAMKPVTETPPGGTGPALSPFPLFSHSNPMAAVQRADGAGRTALGDGNGYTGAPPSFRMRLYRPSSWTEVIQTNNGLAFGGNALTVAGASNSQLSEIPLIAPLNLAQYTHANFGLRDQQPLFAIGNSFASTLVSPNRSYQTNGPNWTEFDSSYLLNHALWDAYFLSSAAPEMTHVATPADPQPAQPMASLANSNSSFLENRSLKQVLDDFANDVTPLANPRMSLYRNSKTSSDLRTALGQYQSSASVLLNLGAFNVNSTSVEAWTALLGAAKKTAIAQYGNTLPSAQQNARFPRTTPVGLTQNATGNLSEPSHSNWQGIINLTDTQILALAQAIVKENKARFTVLTRTEQDNINQPASRLFRGLTTAATPYLGMTEFVNRFLGNTAWTSRSGTLQAAILRADETYNAGISDRLSNKGALGAVSANTLGANTAGWTSNPTNIEAITTSGNNKTHAAMGAAGNLLQSDLLQVIGTSLATRSDTFTVRVYGEANMPDGSTARRWVEAVAQRIPDYLDNTNVAETGSSAPRLANSLNTINTNSDFTLNNQLTPVNRLLGRRFKIIAMRWLTPDEI